MCFDKGRRITRLSAIEEAPRTISIIVLTTQLGNGLSIPTVSRPKVTLAQFNPFPSFGN